MKTLYIWLVAMIQKLFTKGDLPTVKEEDSKLLALNLQFFADDDDDDDAGGDDNDDDSDDDSDDDDDDDSDDAPDLDELLKDRAFRKQYNERFKGQMTKRMKKKDEEIERLKGGKKKDEKKDDDEDTSELESRLQDKEKRLVRAERREKRATVKEFAIDNGYDPKLLARLINLDEIELDDDGEPENIDELFDEIEEEFPGYFGDSDDEEDEEEDKKSRKRKRGSYSPGSRQKGNRKKKITPQEAGRLKALERHKKEEK